MKQKNKGISLIVLVITIIVMIIIAGAIIISLTGKNVIEKAKQGRFMTNIQGYNAQIQNYIVKEQLENSGFNSALINATGEEIKTYIPGIKEEDLLKFKIQTGKLVYIGKDDKEKEILKTIGVISDKLELFNTNDIYDIIYINPSPPIITSETECICAFGEELDKNQGEYLTMVIASKFAVIPNPSILINKNLNNSTGIYYIYVWEDYSGVISDFNTTFEGNLITGWNKITATYSGDSSINTSYEFTNLNVELPMLKKSGMFSDVSVEIGFENPAVTTIGNYISTSPYIN